MGWGVDSHTGVLDFDAGAGLGAASTFRPERFTERKARAAIGCGGSGSGVVNPPGVRRGCNGRVWSAG